MTSCPSSCSSKSQAPSSNFSSARAAVGCHLSAAHGILVLPLQRRRPWLPHPQNRRRQGSERARESVARPPRLRNPHPQTTLLPTPRPRTKSLSASPPKGPKRLSKYTSPPRSLPLRRHHPTPSLTPPRMSSPQESSRQKLLQRPKPVAPVRPHLLPPPSPPSPQETHHQNSKNKTSRS